VVREQRLFLFFKDINTQTDQFWQFSMSQFSVVVRDRETKFVSGPRVSEVENRCHRQGLLHSFNWK